LISFMYLTCTFSKKISFGILTNIQICAGATSFD
jgi:hypothetical protein